MSVGAILKTNPNNLVDAMIMFVAEIVFVLNLQLHAAFRSLQTSYFSPYIPGPMPVHFSSFLRFLVTFARRPEEAPGAAENAFAVRCRHRNGEFFPIGMFTDAPVKRLQEGAGPGSCLSDFSFIELHSVFLPVECLEDSFLEGNAFCLLKQMRV